MEIISNWLPLILSTISFLCLCILVAILVFVVRSSTARQQQIKDLFQHQHRLGRRETADEARLLRREILAIHKTNSANLLHLINQLAKSHRNDIARVEKRIKDMVATNEALLEKLRSTIDGNLENIRKSNEQKLDQMRRTVDEKLHATLERRLGESFKLVSERLEAVQHGLGDMQHLATGVGDLKRMLTNVKSRGTWGEFQLGDILEQTLTRTQFEKNVQPKPGSSKTVEYAVRLPGADKDHPIWLPIDAKFPQEDYQRLIDATEEADIPLIEQATKALVRAVQKSAADISGKYISPPHTTDFAIMFLPTEGLYSELLRQPGLVEKMQQDYRILIAGPTTLTALLNSLRMGFRTLAIEKRSSEVWLLLSAVKTEFNKFEAVLAKVKKQLHSAANTLDQTNVRTRAMERKLRDVEELPLDGDSPVLDFLSVDTDKNKTSLSHLEN